MHAEQFREDLQMFTHFMTKLEKTLESLFKQHEELVAIRERV